MDLNVPMPRTLSGDLEAIGAELSHHGVKGMKWGVRRNDKQLATARAKATVDAKGMTDTELRAKINRIQMEKQYVDLIAPTPKISSKSETFVKKILADTAKQVAQEQAKKYASKGAEMVISGAISKTTGVRAPKHRK